MNDISSAFVWAAMYVGKLIVILILIIIPPWLAFKISYNLTGSEDLAWWFSVLGYIMVLLFLARLFHIKNIKYGKNKKEEKHD